MTKPEADEKLGMPIILTIPYVARIFTLANNGHLPLSSRFTNDSAAIAIQKAFVSNTRVLCYNGFHTIIRTNFDEYSGSGFH